MDTSRRWWRRSGVLGWRGFRHRRGVLAWLLVGALLASEGYPELDIEPPDPSGPDPLAGLVPVWLPPEPAAAITLLHEWNAHSAVLPTPPAGKAAWQVPSLRACVGASGKDGADPARDPGVQAWAVIARRAYPQRPDPALATELAFPLLRVPGALVLPTPGEAYRERLQTFIDGRWLAAGHADPPRLRPEAAVPPPRPRATAAPAPSAYLRAWATWVVVACGLLVIAAAWCPGRWRWIQVGLGAVVVVVGLIV